MKWSLLAWLACGLLVACADGTSQTVAETSANAGASGAGSAGTSSAGSGGSGAIDLGEKAGSSAVQPEQPYHMCNDQGLIRMTVAGAIGNKEPVSTTGYVVDFDHGRVLGSLDLMNKDSGTLDPSSLEPPATCAELNTSATFSLIAYSDGTFYAPSVSPRTFGSGGGGKPCHLEFNTDLHAEEVRLFGFDPAKNTLDGPVVFDKMGESSWHATTEALAARCQETPGYVFILAGHEQGRLVGLLTQAGHEYF